jgi:alpha-beta hydrolase superfamily lysophospholipase
MGANSGSAPSAATPVPLIRRQESYFVAAAKREVFTREWLADAPRAAALLIHGLAEHSGRYEHVGTWLAGRGIAVHSYDHQGHGHSPGIRCYVRRFADLVDDAKAVLGRVRSAHPELPLFVIGHSMGGLVTASLACEDTDVAGFAITGAALATPVKPSPLRLAALRILRWLLPRVSVDNELDPQGLSTDPEVVHRYLEDPLVTRRITISLACELFDQMRRIEARGSAVTRPLLALHGEDDPICASAGSAAFAAAAPRGRYLGFPGMRHEILNEPGREAVTETILGWLDEGRQQAVSDGLSHLDERPRPLVDVGDKPVTSRSCVARGAVG